MKKYKKTILIFLLSAATCMQAFCAYLGFYGEQNTVKPGEPFTVDLIAFFDEDEPQFWSEDPTVRISLYDWVGTISVLSCDWNESEWNFEPSRTYFGETDTTTFLWAEASPVSRFALTSHIVLATLHCFAYDTFPETLGYDMLTNYYGIDGDGFSNHTTGYNEIYTNLPTSITCDGEDILGEEHDPEDGTDSFDIEVFDMPSYQIELLPENPDIPLTISETMFELQISKMSEIIQPAFYDHVRVVMEYDRAFVKCVNSEAIINSVPGFLTNVSVYVQTNNYYGDTITEDIVIEGFCEPTDYAGLIAVIELLPLKMEQDIDLDFTGWHIETSTAVDRFGKADLLGFPDDENDGMPDAFLNITNVPGLFFELENPEEFLIAGTDSTTHLVLKNEGEDNVAIDSLTFEMLYNTNLISMTSPEFLPNLSILHSSGTNVNISFSVEDNLILQGGPLTNDYSYLWTNSKVRLNISFGNPLIVTQEFTEIGLLNFIPTVPGMSGFLAGENKIIYNESNIHDPDGEFSGWPFTFSVLEQGEEDNQLFVSLVSDINNPETITPGTLAELNIFSYCRRPVNNASYSLYWTYDSNALSFEGGTPSVSNLTIITDLDETTSVICVQSDSFSSSFNTNLLGKVTFKALEPETVFLGPVTYDVSETHYCRFEENGQDILGTSSSPDDGVDGEILDIESIDELTLTFNPAAALHAGLKANSYLEIENPEEVLWDYCSIKIILDKEEILLPTNAWQATLPGQFQIISNYVKEVNLSQFVTNINQGVTNTYVATNDWFEACLIIISQSPTNFSGVIASVPIIPLEDSPYWEFIFKGHTIISLNGVSLTEKDSYDSDFWDVNPNYMLVELKDQIEAPILGVEYPLTAQIKNPLSIPFNRAAVCWSFDSEVMEVRDVKLTNGFSGDVWVNNNNDGYGYLCADISRETFISLSNVHIMNISIYPKVAGFVEMEPDEDVLDNDLELGMGIFSGNDINLLELLYGVDNPYWERVVVYRSMPQLHFDDIEIDKNSFYIIEDLLVPGEGLVNADEYSNKTFLWWAEENENVDVVFNSILNTARFTPNLDWVGEETFRIFCKDSDNQVGSSLVRVVVEDTYFELDVDVERDDYVAATHLEFTEINFNIYNSTSNEVEVIAFLIGPGGVTNYAGVQNIDTGEMVTSPENFTNGRLIWQTPGEPGMFAGRVIVRNSNNVLQTASDVFWVEVVKGNTDDDGDRFVVKVNNANYHDINGRSIYIDASTDNATVKVKIIRNPNGGDGRVALDSIKCNKGLKKIKHTGDIQLIDLGGPLHSLMVKQGTVGTINIANGGIHSIKINNGFNKEYEDFYEAGILYGINCNGSIGTIKITGGNLGDEFEPAVIKTKGSIKNIITKRGKKVIMDEGWADIYLLGGNCYASLYVDKNIGSIMAIGGSVGIPDSDEYDYCEIECKGNIKSISAVAKKGDAEVLGGYIHSDIFCNGHIGRVSAIGGDITRETELEPDEISDDIALNTVFITATSIKKIESKAKSYMFKDGEPNPEWWWWEAHGGNMVIDIRPPVQPKPMIHKFAIERVSSFGGTLCAYIEALGNINSVTTKTISYHEDYNSANILRGGNMEFSCIKPNIADKDLNDPKNFSYNGFLKLLSVKGVIKNSRIFSKGPFNEHRIKYGALENDSEIWIDGEKVLSSK